jgi:hypothetical protein
MAGLTLDSEAGALAGVSLIGRRPKALCPVNLDVVGPKRARFGFCQFNSPREVSSGDPAGG